jgi:hypothetical protein
LPKRQIAELRKMKKIQIKDKTQIKQLLYAEWVFGIKDDQYRSFGGFQLRWFDKRRGVCDCCQSRWSDPRKRLAHYTIDKAAKILWHNRHRLYVRTKHVSEDKKLQILEHLEQVRQ